MKADHPQSAPSPSQGADWAALPIAGMQKLSLQDFPATPAAILFTPGCNLRCPYCHNACLLQDATCYDSHIISDFLIQRQGRLKGVVISGGEPSLHPGLPDFLRAVRGLGYRIKLDSNGMLPEPIQAVIDEGLIDYLALDWKLPGQRYPSFGGPPDAAERLLACATAARRAGMSLEWRTTVALPLLDRTDLDEIAQHFLPEERWSLQTYQASSPELATEGQLSPPPASFFTGLREAYPALQIHLR